VREDSTKLFLNLST